MGAVQSCCFGERGGGRRGGGRLGSAMSSGRYEQHQAPKCATRPADRTTGLAVDWNGVAAPQTTIVLTATANSPGSALGGRCLQRNTVARPAGSRSF